MYQIIFITPGMPAQSVVEDYEEAVACALKKGTYQCRWICQPGLSAASAQEYHRDEPTFASDDKVVLVFYSAGYGWVREALRDQGFIQEKVVAMLSIDSIHDNHELSTMWCWRPMAERLRDMFVMLHTDVEPGSYASTTDTAKHIEKWGARRVHLKALSQLSPRQQHGQAFVNKGRTYLEYLLKGLPQLNLPWHDSEITFPERCLLWSEHQATNRIGEVPRGSNKGPDVQMYFEGAMRNGSNAIGKWMSKTGGNWCAAGFCYAELAACIGDEERFVPHVVSGIELERWAKKHGHWTEDPSIVRPGDGIIMNRNGSNWERHVARVRGSLSLDGDIRTVEANLQNMWRFAVRRPSNIRDAILGYILYPREEKTPEPEGPGVDMKKLVEEWKEEFSRRADELAKLWEDEYR